MNIIKSIDERKLLISEIVFLIKNNTKLDIDNLFTYNLINSYKINLENKNKSIFEVRVTTKGLLYFSTVDDQLIFSDHLSIGQLSNIFDHLINDIDYKLQEVKKSNTENNQKNKLTIF